AADNLVRFREPRRQLSSEKSPRPPPDGRRYGGVWGRAVLSCYREHTTSLGDNAHLRRRIAAQLTNVTAHRTIPQSAFRDPPHTDYRLSHEDFNQSPAWRLIMTTVDYSNFQEVQKSEEFQRSEEHTSELQSRFDLV